ncbi:MAG: glycosyltransferase family 1 protein [Nitrososphaeria archaeon]
MKVALVGAKNEFNAGLGFGVPRAMVELYNHIKENKYGIMVSKVELGKLPFLSKPVSYTLLGLLKNFGDYDIIHNVGYYPLIPVRKHVTLITTVHDLMNIYAPLLVGLNKNTPYSKLWYKIQKYVTTKSILRSKVVIAVSSLTKEEVKKLVNINNIKVINLGIDNRFRFVKKTTKNNKLFVLGYLGSFSASKNVSFAIKAVSILNGQIKNITFELWGKKERQYSELKSNTSSNIKFMGFAPENKLIQIYDSFDVFVFPSLYEGFGLPIIEAQARGLPVIIYKYGKIPKEVRKYCFEAESPEHMAQIMEDLKENGYNEKLKKKATEYARSFTWEKTAEETLKVYKHVLNE